MKINLNLQKTNLFTCSFIILLLTIFLSGSFLRQAELPTHLCKSWSVVLSRNFCYLKSGYYDEIYNELAKNNFKNSFEHEFHKKIFSYRQNNRALKKTILKLPENNLNVKSIDTVRVLPEICVLASKIFGYNVVYPNLFFYGMLFCSAIIFYRTFFENNRAIISLSLVLISISGVVIKAPEIGQLYALHNTRGWTVLTVIPALHLWYFITSSKPQKALPLGFQLFLPSLVMFERQTSFWFFIYLALVLVVHFFLDKHQKKINLKKGFCICFVLLLNILILFVFFSKKENKTSRYPIWHAVLTGLLLNENARTLAGLNDGRKGLTGASDNDSFKAVYLFLLNKNKIQSNAQKTLIIKDQFDWNKYDADARDTSVAILKGINILSLTKTQLIKVFLFFKYFFSEGSGLGWILVPYVFITPFLFINICKEKITNLKFLEPLIIIFIVSLTPILATYVQPHGLTECLVALFSVILGLSLFIFEKIVQSYHILFQTNKTSTRI